MAIRYYLTIFPTESLVASGLDPMHFGAYMATGSKKGAFENIMFIEVEGGFDSTFDWEHAKEKCVPHEDGSPKNSVYLGIYKALENIPLDKFKSMYLTTRDGRTLELPKDDVLNLPSPKAFYVYQEISPIQPLVVSTKDPSEFGKEITSGKESIWVPKLIFADLKVIDFDNPETTGNIGASYDHNIEHLKDCIQEVTENSKLAKTVERSHISSFSYQIINHGVFIVSKNGMISYKMKTMEEIRQHYYDWGRSAMIL